MCGPNSNFKELNVPELWQFVLQMNVEREDFSGACEERKEKEISVFDSLDNPILMKLGTRLHFFIFYKAVIQKQQFGAKTWFHATQPPKFFSQTYVSAFSTWQKVSFYTLVLKRRFKWQIKYIVHEIKISSH